MPKKQTMYGMDISWLGGVQKRLEKTVAKDKKEQAKISPKRKALLNDLAMSETYMSIQKSKPKRRRAFLAREKILKQLKQTE